MIVFCLIPARGGSKGVPHKNVVPFLGKPLLEHSIDYAKSSLQVDHIFVSTDDDQIAEVAAGSGAKVITRPAEISGDTSSTESAISHALEVWDEQNATPDVIVLLQATSPLRPVGSLDKALEIFTRGKFDSLLSISPSHRFFWRLDGDLAQAEYDYENRPRRQDMSEKDMRFLENGSLYIFTRAHFEKTKNRLGGKIGYTLFPEEYSFEIDSTTDIKLLENIALGLSE